MGSSVVFTLLAYHDPHREKDHVGLEDSLFATDLGSTMAMPRGPLTGFHKMTMPEPSSRGSIFIAQLILKLFAFLAFFPTPSSVLQTVSA